MIYFEEKDKTINKFVVTYDKEELSKLRKEVIDKCSHITHYEVNYHPGFIYGREVRNHQKSSKPVGVREYEDSADEYIYLHTFDEYKYPKLVEIIDGLLKDNPDSLKKLYSIPKDNCVILNEKISATSKKIESTEASDTETLKEQLKIFEELLESKRLNQCQVPASLYYEKIQDLITYDLVDFIKIDDLLRVTEFFDKKPTDLGKIIKLDKKKKSR